MGKQDSTMTAGGAIDLLIEPRARDLGGFDVRRVLPSGKRAMVGPFIFFDHIGPAEFPPGEGIAVRPHPHIGLATVTYLFEGEILHRDSLGFVQPIHCGAVNLMTAGRGIVHSERAGDDLHEHSHLHGIQSWMALPLEEEECDPAFVHYPAADIPGLRIGAAEVRVVIGTAWGLASPVQVAAPMLYLECRLPAGARLALPDHVSERAVYLVTGQVRLAGQDCQEGVMAVLREGAAVEVEALTDSLFMVLGGEPVGKRHIWWNYVSSSLERIERAKADWREGRFAPVPGETEFIPLPD